MHWRHVTTGYIWGTVMLVTSYWASLLATTSTMFNAAIVQIAFIQDGAQRPVTHTLAWFVRPSGSHLDLIRAPCGLYGVHWIDLVPLSLKMAPSGSHLDLIRAHYGLYGVHCIDLV